MRRDSTGDRSPLSATVSAVLLAVLWAVVPQRISTVALATLTTPGAVPLWQIHTAVAEGSNGTKKKPRPLLRQACEGDCLWACGALGFLYSHGRGVEQDPATAARLYRRACDEGSAPSCNNLGFLYFWGRGVDQDLGEGARLLLQALQGRLPVWLERPEVLRNDIRSVLRESLSGR